MNFRRKQKRKIELGKKFRESSYKKENDVYKVYWKNQKVGEYIGPVAPKQFKSFNEIQPNSTDIRFVETGITGISFPAHKYINELTIRAKIEYGSVLRVYVSYDSEPFEELQILQGVGNVESYNFPLNPARADHYRLRLEGRDSVLIYSIASHVEEGSEEDGI